MYYDEEITRVLGEDDLRFVGIKARGLLGQRLLSLERSI